MTISDSGHIRIGGDWVQPDGFTFEGRLLCDGIDTTSYYTAVERMVDWCPYINTKNGKQYIKKGETIVVQNRVKMIQSITHKGR